MSTPKEERKDLLTVADFNGTVHLRKWDRHSEDGSYMRMWCAEEFNHEEIVTFTFPMGLLNYEALCLDCYYQKRQSTEQMFDDMDIQD